VRTAPTEIDRLPARVPDSLPAPELWHEKNAEPEPSLLPSRLDEVWTMLLANPLLANALTIWHQGLLLTPVYPSFALVAFTGAIEGIAESGAITELAIVPPEHYPKCEHSRHRETVQGCDPACSQRR
jgi:hypothetical protein